MDNFDDVEQEVMAHDAEDVSAVVRELVEMTNSDINSLPTTLRMKVIKMLTTFNYWNGVLYEKANQKRIIHRYGQAE